MVQSKPFLVMPKEDVNAKSSNWFFQDKISFEGNAIESSTSQFVLHQMIKEPTHILETFFLCINLIFMSQPNLITESGVHLSLHKNCHYQIIYAKFQLEIIYSSLYAREVLTKMLTSSSLDKHLMNPIGKGSL